MGKILNAVAILPFYLMQSAVGLLDFLKVSVCPFGVRNNNRRESSFM